MIFESDRQFEILWIDKFEGRILRIGSNGPFPRTKLLFVHPDVYELPTRFEGIIVREGNPGEIDSISLRLDPRFLHERNRIYVIESSGKIYFVACLSVHVVQSESTNHASLQE
jgi:hypothetical protein